MEAISIPYLTEVGTLTFTGVLDGEEDTNEDSPVIHVFELLKYPECKLVWMHDLDQGELQYPSDEWLAEKLQEILDDRNEVS